MPILSNPKWEHFSQLIAAGESQTQAYSIAYPKATSGQGQSASKLVQNPEVAARISELVAVAASIPSVQVWLTRVYILEKLREVVDKGMDAKKFGDVVSAIRLLGLETGMFREKVDHTFWDGNPATLTEDQRKQLLGYLEKLEFGGDPRKLAEAKRQALLEAGETVPAELEVVEVEPEE